MKLELKKTETTLIQGVSVVAMILLHLFCRTDFEGLYSPLVFIGNQPLIYMIAQLSDFCVMGFAFCSGYAHYLLYYKKDNYYKNRIKSLIRLLINFWVICIAFCVISVIVGKADLMPGSMQKFILNFLTFSNSYNGAWWYLSIYIVITLLSPLVISLCQKNKSIIFFVGVLLLYVVSYYMRFKLTDKILFAEHLGKFGMTLFEYSIGMLFCKEKFITCLRKNEFLQKKYMKYIHLLLIVSLLFIRTFVVRSLFVAPVSGIIVLLYFLIWDIPKWMKKFFGLMGKHSTNIWLVHMFFYTELFSGLVFIVKYPLFIFVFMVILCMISSFCIKFITEKIYLLVNI